MILKKILIQRHTSTNAQMLRNKINDSVEVKETQSRIGIMKKYVHVRVLCICLSTIQRSIHHQKILTKYRSLQYYQSYLVYYLAILSVHST